MKKFIVVALCSLLAFPAVSQPLFGIKAGLNLANQSVSASTGSGSVGQLTSFHVGFTSQWRLSEKFAIQPELVYSGQGWKTDLLGFGVSLNANYLNVPVVFQFYPTEEFHVDFGPQVGFLLSANGSISGSSGDVSSSYKSTDFALAFGMGYDITKMVALGVRYNLGLTDVDTDPDLTTKNNVIQFSLNYRFTKGD